MRYRTEEDIIANILEVVIGKKDGCSKTDILYGARLTYFQLVKNYMPLLTEKKLISYNESKNVYKITEKGLKALELQREYSQIMKGNIAN